MFEEFLENRFRSIEFLDPKVQKQDKPNYTHVATTVVSCSFCSENHKICNCKKFASETTDARRKFAQTHHLCFNCLNTDHSVYQCKFSTRCRLCKKKHHTLLHPKNQKSTNDSVKVDQLVSKSVVAAVTASTSTSQANSEASDAQTITSCLLNTHSQVLLPTALVNVEANKNRMTVVLRSLLDQGSQASFVTESAVQILGLKKKYETSLVCGLGGDRDSTITSKSTVLLKLQSRLDPNYTIRVKAHVLNKLTCFLPSATLPKVQGFPALSSVELADPLVGSPTKIDLLLGVEVYSQILLEGLLRGPPGSVIAQNTRLGWILSGVIHTPNEINHSDKCRNIVSMHLVKSNENELLKKFSEMETEPSSRGGRLLTTKEQKCEESFPRATQEDDCGRCAVRLPFRSDNPLRRYSGLKDTARKLLSGRRSIKGPEPKDGCSKTTNLYPELSHMESVSHPTDLNTVHLPHHVAVKQDRTLLKLTTDVMHICIKRCQGQYFDEELKSKKGKFSSLSPYKDSDGVWRVSGRLQGSDLSENRKHPVLIPRQSHRHKWKNSTHELELGAVGPVKEDDLPPARWLYEIGSKKHYGPDNITRVVSFRHKSQTIKGPVSKLAVLPVND